MRLLAHEFIDIASRPMLWIGTLAFCIFLLHAASHLNIEEDAVVVGIYHTQADTDAVVQTFRPVQSLLQEMANVRILKPRLVTTDVASQMMKDGADIALTRTIDGWRFMLKSRSALEHRRLVRVTQVLGASISQERPWFLIAYDSLRRANQPIGTPGTRLVNVQISGITADPGRHARVFVPKTIALLAYFIAFAIACRSMIRDISDHTLLPILVASEGRLFPLLLAKVLVSVLMGLFVLWTLLLFAVSAQDFQIKEGLYFVTVIQLVGVTVSALLGLAFSLLARSESRIYLIGSAYLVLLVLLSGLIARIDPNEKILAWISSVFPLGYGMDILSDWMFFGLVPSLESDPTQIMFALLFLSIMITYGSALYLRRSF